MVDPANALTAAWRSPGRVLRLASHPPSPGVSPTLSCSASYRWGAAAGLSGWALMQVPGVVGEGLSSVSLLCCCWL